MKKITTAVLTTAITFGAVSVASAKTIEITNPLTSATQVVSLENLSVPVAQADTLVGEDTALETVEVARASRAERRAARRAARRGNRANRAPRNNDAPFGFRADGQPRTQPITRSDQRLRDNGGELNAIGSFSDLIRGRR